MNPDKNSAVLSDACAALGIPSGAEPRVHMARLMNLPEIQPVNTATVAKPMEAKPSQHKVLCQKTFVENERTRIMSCQGVKANDEQAVAEATRRWERTKKKTLTVDDMAIANDQVTNMVQEIQHNGWKLVLIDDQNHYYRFPVKAGAATAVSSPTVADTQRGTVAEAAVEPAKPSDDAVKVHLGEKNDITAPTAENDDLKRRASMLDHPTDDEEDRPSTFSLKRKLSDTDTDLQTA